MSLSSPRLAATLLVAFVPLATTPLVIIDQLWLGSSMFGAGLGSDRLFAGLGVAVFIGIVVPILALAVAPAVWRGARRSAAVAVGLVAVMALLSAGPLHDLSPTSWLPGGRLLLLAWALLAASSLLL
ncbi:MAG: hypothetical protein WBF18_00740, partial [Solirubrobacterales bacterium]